MSDTTKQPREHEHTADGSIYGHEWASWQVCDDCGAKFNVHSNGVNFLKVSRGNIELDKLRSAIGTDAKSANPKSNRGERERDE